MCFYYTHTSLPINRATDHKHTQLGLKEGARLFLEARWTAEEQHTLLEAEEEVRLVEEANLKYQKEEYAWLEATIKAEEEEEYLLLKSE